MVLCKGTSYKSVHHTHSRSCVSAELTAKEDTQGSSGRVDTGVEIGKDGIGQWYREDLGRRPGLLCSEMYTAGPERGDQ